MCPNRRSIHNGYAEYTTVPEGYLAHMPKELTFEEAAGPSPALVLRLNGADARAVRTP